MKSPKAVILDLDDTIIDDSSAVSDCWKVSCREAAALIEQLDSASLLTAIGQQRDWFWSDSERARAGRLDLRRASTQIVDQALRSLGYPSGVAPLIGNRYRDLREERAALFPGALETIEWLRGQDIRLGYGNQRERGRPTSEDRSFRSRALFRLHHC
jgi:putative hydrolase of the HAD superfamily